ncbi:MAG: gamma-glutamyltransferase family protein [Proteobacteria bacterium]|nr:gamma-glutamyltransferase family protein [Pseudomonadota bacterium]
MRRRSFLAALPATAAATAAAAQQTKERNNRPVTDDAPARAQPAASPDPVRHPDIRSGDRVSGAPWASRSSVWGVSGAAATAHPTATMLAIDILRRGGSAVDAAIAANAALGFLEPTGCGIGGDLFAMLWDPKLGKVVGLNASGRSPRGLSLATVRSRAKNGAIPSFGAISVSVPGCVDGWAEMHARYGRLPWKEVIEPAAALAEQGVPVPQTIAYYLERNFARFGSAGVPIEELENARATYAPGGRTAAEGQVFKNPDLARTYRLIAAGGRDAFYQGPIAETIERYFRRIGGWMTRADLAAHRSEWVEPLRTSYRGEVEAYGLPPNSQGLSTLQLLSIAEQFDLKRMGFLSAASIHHQAEAKRIAFEDRARYFADPAFGRIPLEWLNSKAYAQERARLVRPDRINTSLRPGQAPSQGDTTYFTVADRDGMMVSLIQSNYRGMGSGLVPDRLGFMFQDRGELFALTDRHPNLYAPGKRPFQTIIPGFATRGGKPWLSFGVMGGGMQPQGQAQIIINMVDYGLDLQAAGDAPRWQHEGSPEPTGAPAEGAGVLRLESGVPDPARRGLAALGWKLGEPDGGFGGYQAILRGPGAYAAASEMRKDGLALAY